MNDDATTPTPRVRLHLRRTRFTPAPAPDPSFIHDHARSRLDNLHPDVMPASVWTALVAARAAALRGDPRAWYRLLREHCAYRTGSSVNRVLGERIDAWVRERGSFP